MGILVTFTDITEQKLAQIELKKKPIWEILDKEVAINLEAPIHLSTIFIPHLLKQKQPAIIICL